MSITGLLGQLKNAFNRVEVKYDEKDVPKEIEAYFETKETLKGQLSPEVIAAREEALSPVFEKLEEIGLERELDPDTGKYRYYRKRTEEEKDTSFVGLDEDEGEVISSPSLSIGPEIPVGNIGYQPVPVASLPKPPSYGIGPTRQDSSDFDRKREKQLGVLLGSPFIRKRFAKSLIGTGLV